MSVEDCAWNPTVAGLAALCLSDGTLMTIDVNGTAATINSLPTVGAR